VGQQVRGFAIVEPERLILVDPLLVGEQWEELRPAPVLALPVERVLTATASRPSPTVARRWWPHLPPSAVLFFAPAEARNRGTPSGGAVRLHV
jgi:hypothetical protein